MLHVNLIFYDQEDWKYSQVQTANISCSESNQISYCTRPVTDLDIVYLIIVPYILQYRGLSLETSKLNYLVFFRYLNPYPCIFSSLVFLPLYLRCHRLFGLAEFIMDLDAAPLYAVRNWSIIGLTRAISSSEPANRA